MKKLKAQQKALIDLLFQLAKENGLDMQSLEEKTGLDNIDLMMIQGGTRNPSLRQFLALCDAVGVNFFFESKDSQSDNNLAFENAMNLMGRRPDALNKN